MSQEIIENAKVIARKVESILRVLSEERGGDAAGTLPSLSYDVVEEVQIETLSKQIISAATSMMKATTELRLRAMLLEDKELIEHLRSEQQKFKDAEPELVKMQEELEGALLSHFETLQAQGAGQGRGTGADVGKS